MSTSQDKIRAKQIAEAQSFMKEGKSLCGRTLTRWSPDYDSAATKFEKAANAYRNLKMSKEAYDAYKEAANAHYKANNIYHAAKNVELAANILRDDKKFSDAASEYEKAADVYLEDGKIERAAELLKNTARLLADKDPQVNKTKVIGLFKKSLQLFSDHDGDHLSEEGFRSFNTFVLKLNMYDECVENLRKEISMYESLKQPHNVYKCYLSIVIVLLAKEDWAAADDAHQDFLQRRPEYEAQEECSIAVDLLKAFENNDGELLASAQKRNKLKFLENSIAQLVKRLSLNPSKKVLPKVSKPRVGNNNGGANFKTADLGQKKAALFDGLDEGEKSEEDPDEQEEPASKQKKQEENDELVPPSLQDTKKQPTTTTQKTGSKPTEDEEGEEEDLDAFDPNNLT